MTQASATSILPTAPVAGVNLHITSLPGAYGIGSVGLEARAFIDTLVAMGQAVWQVLPLGPTSYGDSPYQSLSSFAGNELLIDIDDLMLDGLLDRQSAQPLMDLPRERVDYGALIPLKKRVLHTVAQEFFERASRTLKSDFDRFVAREKNWLHDYAQFRVLKDMHHEQPWTQWPEAYRRRDETALERLSETHATAIEHVRILQFLFDRQWQQLKATARAAGVLLFGDLPIYLAMDSADAWAHRDLLSMDLNGNPQRVAGVPPDYFSEDGQLWGNPLYDWEVHRRTGFAWWIERIVAASQRTDLVRLDHFRGLESYWSVPAKATTARDGEWQPGPGDAFFDAVRSALGGIPLIAEDLGEITPMVEALRDRHRIPGMVVLQFKVDEDGFALDGVPENCVCYSATHDNDTTLGWFQGEASDTRSDEERGQTQERALRLTGGTPETIAHDMVRAALSTPARLCIAPMQDYLQLGSEARLNTPGVAGRNWQWRLQKAQLAPAFCASIKTMVQRSGREFKNG